MTAARPPPPITAAAPALERVIGGEALTARVETVRELDGTFFAGNGSRTL